MDKNIFLIMTNGIIDLSLVCHKKRRQKAKEYKRYDYDDNPFFKIHCRSELKISPNFFISSPYLVQSPSRCARRAVS